MALMMETMPYCCHQQATENPEHNRRYRLKHSPEVWLTRYPGFR
jgi:hypothetical protein